MKYKTKKRIQGSISILLVVILMPMLTMSAIVVDASRVNLARSMVSSAGDLTVNTALANYDTILKDVYGLFAMSQATTDEEFQALIKEYFETTLVGYGVVDEENAGEYVEQLESGLNGFLNGTESLDDLSRNFMNMTIEENSFKATKVENSSLANSEILRTQLVEYMKYRAPLSVGLSFLDSIKSFTTIQDQNNVVKSQVAAQESAQDVNSACKKSIDSIRAFDDLIESIENGDKAVKGFSNSTDGKIVKLEKYSEQVDMYRNLWGENYKRINQLTLTFFTKNPGINDKVLGKLGSTKFINTTDSYKLVTNNSGVNVSVNLAGDANSAKTQYTQQLSKVNGLVNTLNTYVNQNFVPAGNLNSDSTNFTIKLSNAASVYINFEKFLLDQHSTINHKDIKNILEQLLTYRKYYENYLKYLKEIENKEKGEMNAAQSDYNSKKSAFESAESARTKIISETNKIKNWIENTNRSYINTQTTNFNKSHSTDFLNGVYIKSKVDSLLSELKINATNRYVSGQTFRDYSNVKHIVSGSGIAGNIYLEVFGKITVSDIPGVNQQLLDKANEYYTKKIAGRTSKSFSSYVNIDKNSDLYALLNTLDLCSTKAETMLSNITAYNNQVSKYSKAKSKADSARSQMNAAETKLTKETTDYNKAKTNRINLETEYVNTAKKFTAGVERYQTDLSTYGKYTTTAKNIAVKEAKAVKNQFSAIESNLKDIIDQLGKIESNLTTTKEMIEAYNKKVDSWENQNKSYSSKNGSDNFSEQNSSDIQSTRNEYDLDSLKNLQDYVTSIKDEYNILYSHITKESNYKYGKTKINTIDSADKLTGAVSDIKGNLKDIVTINDADAQFEGLYKYYNAPKIFQESSQPKFLEPNIIPLQFLIYLDVNYPEKAATADASASTGENSAESSGSSNSTSESDYKSAKENLKAGSKDKEESGDFGYTYKSKEIPGNLPSGTSDETKTVDKYKLKESDDKVDASSGLSEQSGVLDSVLGGIGNVATAGLENLYLLSYIFENFSYNTMVQDIVAKDQSAQEANIANKAKITMDNYTDPIKARTLSNFHIDAKNNFLYGGEVEYILYGSKTPATNVTCAKGSIYALRFAFNCIYAFTDSEIKAMTMSAGLAVQAATLGVVPYKVVQIVLQLAIAAAESAIDLDYIGNGQKVAVIKSRDTWNLSVSSLGKNVSSIASAAVDAVAESAIGAVNGGIQNVLDATTEELTGSINGLADDLSSAVTGKAEEIVNTAFAEVTSRINDALNQVQFINFKEEDGKKEIDKIFAEAKNYDLASLFPDNEIAQKIISSNVIQNAADSIIDNIHSQVIAEYNANVKSPGTAIASKINTWKISAMNSVQNAIKVAFDSAKTYVSGYAEDISTKIKGYATGKVSELTEDAAEKLKGEISDVTNDFMNKYITDGNAVSTMGSGLDATTKNGGTSLANIITFGYKDYLMLFTYIKLCASTGPESTVMKRVADVIQMNIQNNTEGEFKHKKGKDFLMSKACTYIQIDATVQLDMLFLDMEFFNRMVTDETDVDGELSVESDLSGAKMKYSGFLGY